METHGGTYIKVKWTALTPYDFRNPCNHVQFDCVVFNKIKYFLTFFSNIDPSGSVLTHNTTDVTIVNVK